MTKVIKSEYLSLDDARSGRDDITVWVTYESGDIGIRRIDDDIEGGWYERFLQDGLSIQWPEVPSLEEIKAKTFDELMSAGNAITNTITSRYSDAETLSWPVQEIEAKDYRTAWDNRQQEIDDNDTEVEGYEFETKDPDSSIPADALIRGVAMVKGRAILEQADKVLYRAAQFRAIVTAAINLREDVESIMLPEIDTPTKLSQKVEEIKIKAGALEAQLIGG